ncbi:MAG: S-layer homology domain-containing protein [Dysosmobacter sp.]
MNKRFFSLLAAFSLCLTLIPTTAFADDEKRGEDVSPCSCETACTTDNMDKECPVCGAENAIPQNCGQYIPVEDRTGENGSTERADDPNGPTELSAADQVQAMIDGLPNAEEITEDNAEEVKAQLEAIDEAKEKLSDEEIDELDMTRYAEAAAALGALAAPMLLANDSPDEQFTLAPGGTYYFDLSGANIPGTANGTLPDSTLHYVPFTYVGTVNAYSLENEADNDTTSYEHSLFIANYNVTHAVSWDDLNTAGLIFGKDYAVGGVDYTLRAPSVGSNSTGSGDSQRGVPQSNEWDTMLNKNSGYIQNWNAMYSWGQDAYSTSGRAFRGFNSARFWLSNYATYSNPYVGFRPVLEVLNADTLGSGGLKAVTLDLGGGTLGNSSEDIHIIVKTGSKFTAPASDGMTRPAGDTGSYFMWLGSNGKLYAPGASVPADVTKLTAQFALSEQFSLKPGGRYYFDLSAMNIPGTANGGNSDGAVSLPDTSLHYVPFTYVGTIEAYKLTSATATTEEYAQQNKYPHSLFVADYAVTHTISWGGLNDEGLIFGKNYASGGVDYTLRAPSVGSISTGSGDSQRGVPQSNEWDTMLNKNSGYIQNWNKMYSWGQDTSSAAESFRAYRGYNSARFWYYTSSSFRNVYLGFRPVLELPTDLAADSLKAVELLTGEFMPGEQQNWINIIVKKGESFTAPSAEGLPLSDGISADTPMWWVDENLNFYKPGDTVPADVSALSAFYGAFGLFLDRGDGEVEVTPDNYTDIFDDGTASFVLPKGRSLTELGESVNLTSKDILEIYSTGRLERYGCVFPNLKLKNADLTSVRLSKKFIGRENPLFITLDGKNTVGSLNRISMSRNTLSVLGDGSLTLNSALTLGRYTQYGGGSVTMTDGLTAYDLSIDSGSLTVTGDPQAITLRDQDISNLYMGDGVRLFTGSSAQDAAEADVPQLSAKMQEVYKRYQAEDNTLTYEELSALNNALREQFNAIFRQLSGKTYVRITGAWDVTYQPGTDGSGNAVTDIKFYNDALTLRGALFTRTGYTQVGWATVDGGEKVYSFGDVYTKNEALTLYPVWQTDTYAITYDLNGGTAEGNPAAYTIETGAFTLKNPTKSGYTFIGWSGTGLDGENNMTVTIHTGSTGNRTYTAHWRYNGSGHSYSYYTIKATAGAGGSIAPSGNVSVREGRDQTFTITPDKGYAVANVKIDGKSIGAVKSYTFENVSRTHTIEVIFMKANGNPQTGVFVDVATGSYYEDAVDWAVENGITQGTDDTHFSPDGICTRAQAVTFLWRAAGSPVVNYLMPFTDVDEGAYYAEAVRWAASCGIVTGLTETTFGTNGVCTRAQAATMIYRYAQAQGKGFTGAWMFHLPFTDVPEWAYESVAWCYMNGVTTGVNETAFAPGNDCTRAQIVTFLWRAFSK